MVLTDILRATGFEPLIPRDEAGLQRRKDIDTAFDKTVRPFLDAIRQRSCPTASIFTVTEEKQTNERSALLFAPPNKKSDWAAVVRSGAWFDEQLGLQVSAGYRLMSMQMEPLQKVLEYMKKNPDNTSIPSAIAPHVLQIGEPYKESAELLPFVDVAAALEAQYTQ